MRRLFIALPLPADLRLTLADLAIGIPEVSWVDADLMHLTLRFIGEVNRHDAEDIHECLSGVSAPPVTLEVSGTGQFETKGVIRTLWAGIRPSDSLKHLRAKVERAAIEAGQPPEQRRFHPHITLARPGRNAPPDRLHAFFVETAGFHWPPVTIDRFVLYESRLGKNHAVYEPLAEYPLVKPSGG